MFWEETLKDELEKFASTLPAAKSTRRPVTQIRIDVRVERESSWVKLALYRLITESMNNAVFHGEATSIKVQARRDDYDIIVRVMNDGVPLPGDSDVRQSRRGIFSLLAEFEKTFKARTSIEPGPGNEGTIVEVVLPAIPFTFEVPHAENNPVG
jgi:glucose-6-phosphate-specific signal transduction histidine kinase